MKFQQTTKSAREKESRGHGTQEWSVKTINCCTGCSHDCRYCYAKGMAIHYKRLTAEEWPTEKIREHDVNKKHKKYDGWVMIPSSHDITPKNLDAGITVIGNLLKSGNQVLIVSKPHLECIKAICDRFSNFARTFYLDENGRFHPVIKFRFSIGGFDNRLSYWEPNAPSYNERKSALKFAYEQYFHTSVSIEPMLDAFRIDELINDLSPFVWDSIWVGKMNHLGKLVKTADSTLQKAICDIKRGQTDAMIKAIYQRHKKNPLIRWKDSIAKVVGI